MPKFKGCKNGNDSEQYNYGSPERGSELNLNHQTSEEFAGTCPMQWEKGINREGQKRISGEFSGNILHPANQGQLMPLILLTTTHEENNQKDI